MNGLLGDTAEPTFLTLRGNRPVGCGRARALSRYADLRDERLRRSRPSGQGFRGTFAEALAIFDGEAAEVSESPTKCDFGYLRSGSSLQQLFMSPFKAQVPHVTHRRDAISI